MRNLEDVNPVHQAQQQKIQFIIETTTIKFDLISKLTKTLLQVSIKIFETNNDDLFLLHVNQCQPG